jgi:possible sodium/proton antiporter
MDLEFLREINLSGTKMILSTIRDSDVNIAILKVLKEKKSDLILVCIANHIHEAISLYEKGADYVIMPHYIGADHTSIMLEEFGLDVEKFLKNKSQQVESLKKKSNDLLLEELMKK